MTIEELTDKDLLAHYATMLENPSGYIVDELLDVEQEIFERMGANK